LSNEGKKKGTRIDEDEIFKSLSHQVRREIIKVLAKKALSFTEIKNNLEGMDSPTLSYHLKSLQPLLVQEVNKYKLSEIGEAAVNLLSKTDQSVRLSKSKKKFLYAYCITVICWVSASTIIPLIIASNLGRWTTISIQIVIITISSINYLIVWRLRKSY